MAHHYASFRFPVPEAGQYASLIGIQSDLNGVIEYCDYLLNSEVATKRDFVLWEGLCSASVVRYARCFASGVRDKLSHSLLDGADSKLRDFHNYVVELRNKHVAHSVNPFEENVVTLQIGDHFTASTEIVAVNGSHGRTVGLGLGEEDQLKALAEWVLERVKEMMKKEKTGLLALAHRRPLSELKAHGMVEARGATTWADASKRRPHP